MVSGSYDGPIFVFRGDGKGGFLSPVKLAGKDGKDLVLDSATSVSLADWNKDGKPDMFVGTINGPVYYVPNLGGLRIGDPVQLEADGEKLVAADGGPSAYDWDGDGVLDLFLGADDGSLRFMKGKSGDTPEFSSPISILAGLPDTIDQPAMLAETVKTRPALRPKPYIGDWNGDGKTDLMIGDFSLLPGDPPKLTAEQKKERARMTAEQKAQETLLNAVVRNLEVKAAKNLGIPDSRSIPPEMSEKFNTELIRLEGEDADYNRLSQSITEIFSQRQQFEPPVDYHGFVWVFLRR